MVPASPRSDTEGQGRPDHHEGRLSVPRAVCNLRAALDRMGRDVDLLKDLVQFFQEDSRALLVQLRAALVAKDAPKVQYLAHSLKGMLANFNADAATNPALELERMGAVGNLSGSALVLEDLERELLRLEQTLLAEIARL